MATKGASTVNLVAEIKQKTAAVARLRADLAKREAELDQIRQLLEDSKPAPPARLVGQRPRRGQRKSPYFATSSVGLTATLLKEIGKPLHVDEIVRILDERGQKVKRETLIGNLARYVKASLIFARFGPNVFGLKEWPKQEVG